MTIRRDLALLEEDGQLIRTLGGAVLPMPLVKETPFQTKETHHMAQKREIAAKALQLIEEGQTILLDSGTTTLELARMLHTFNTLTVITNDIKIAAELVESELQVMIIGGEMQNRIGAIYGSQAIRFVENIHVDLFFLGAHAIDVNTGVTSPSFEKSFLKEKMIHAAESTWLLADASKIGKKSFAKVCDIHTLTGLITDDELDGHLKEQLCEMMEVL